MEILGKNPTTIQQSTGQGGQLSNIKLVGEIVHKVGVRGG